MANDFRRGIRVYLDSTEYKQGIDQMVNATKDLEGELQKLEAKGASLSGEDLKRKKQLENQVVKNTKAVASYKEKMKETERVLNNLSGSTYNELIRVQQRLEKEMKDGVRGTEKYNAALKQHKRVSDEVNRAKKEMNLTVGAQGSLFSKVAGVANKYWTVLAGGIAAISGVVLSLKSIITSNAKLDDSFADVMKTTGLTREEVVALNREFKALDTRTSRDELNKLASEAGKLGLTGKADILAFVDAGNQINVALGEDLGEDAIKNIGKMVGVFDKSTKYLQGLGLKEQMLAVGSAVNELGASSSASEPYLVQFAGRLGGVASQAGIAIDAILGYGSALDQDMQQVEMSATALQNFIMKIMGDPAKFAQIAGMEVKKFSSLLNTDANAAIKTVLRSLHDKGGFQALIPIFNDMGLDGARAVGVLSSMASSIDKIDEAQQVANRALTEGTSITREYDIRNNNMAANLEKLGKNIRGWFVNSELNNFLNEGVSVLTEMTSKAKTATQEYDELSSKVNNLQKNILPLLDRYDELTYRTARTSEENAEMKTIIDKVIGVMPGAVTQMDNYGNAVAIATQRVRDFIVAERDRLFYVNQTKIKESEKLLKQNVANFLEASKTMEQIKNGTWQVKKTYNTGNGFDTMFFTPTQDDIRNATANYNNLKSIMLGNATEIARLKGYSVTQNQQLRQEDLNNEIDYQNNLSKAGGGSGSGKPWEASVKAAEEQYKTEMLLYSGMYQQKLLGQKTYETISLQREIEFLRAKKKILEDYKQSSIDVQQDIINAQIKLGETNKSISTPGIEIQNIDKEELGKGLKLYLDHLEEKKDADKAYYDWKKEQEEKNRQDIVAVAEAGVNFVMGLHELEASSLEEQKQKELSAAGDNAEARKKIEAKYAQKELDLRKKQANADMVVKIAQTLANGYQAVMKALADLGPIAGPIAAGLIGATTLMQVANIKKQRDVIMATTLDASGSSDGDTVSAARIGNSGVKQAARGRWDVVGAEDGETYRSVPYSGRARTGVVSTPTLVAERGDELIVDNPTLRNIRMNAPYLLGEIKRMRVRQRASGNWSPTQDVPAAPAGSTGDVAAVLTEVSALLRWLKENRIEAYTVLGEFEKKRDLRNTSLRKGSL